MKRFSVVTGLVFFVCSMVMTMGVDAKTSARILFIGDSISAGLGVEKQQAYPELIHEQFRKKGMQTIVVTNGSISGSTTASAVSRLKWHFKVRPDILVLALGANDGLRGLSIENMEKNLDAAIVLAKKQGVRVILAGMKIPPSYGPQYSLSFEQVFLRLAKHHKIALIPFLLKGVAGNASLNQADGIHPNVQGHQIIAATVFPYILDQL